MSAPSVGDVLDRIEFEIAQGLVARADLRRAIRDLRSFHERTRAALFADGASEIDLREGLSRQFQLNDMLIAILAEAAEAAHEAQGEVRRVHGYIHQALAGDGAGEAFEPELPVGVEAEVEPGIGAAVAPPRARRETAARDARTAGERPEGRSPAQVRLEGASGDVEPGPHGWGAHGATPGETALDDPRLWSDDEPPEEVERAMRPETLWLAMDARAPRLPLVGTLLRRFRVALHTRVLIYAAQLGEKQAFVNRVFGDHLLRLRAALGAQQQAIDAIRLRLRRLENRHGVSRRERGGRPPG